VVLVDHKFVLVEKVEVVAVVVEAEGVGVLLVDHKLVLEVAVVELLLEEGEVVGVVVVEVVLVDHKFVLEVALGVGVVRELVEAEQEEEEGEVVAGRTVPPGLVLAVKL
jgi:hypothetical protein